MTKKLWNQHPESWPLPSLEVRPVLYSFTANYLGAAIDKAKDDKPADAEDKPTPRKTGSICIYMLTSKYVCFNNENIIKTVNFLLNYPVHNF